MNTSYLPENTTAIAQAIFDSSYSEMRSEYVKWGGGESVADAKMTEYSANLTTFKSELTKRSNVVRNNIISNFGLSGRYSLELQVQPKNAGVIQINTISPEVYPWTGIYFAGVPIRMEAKSYGNYVFDGWVLNTIIKDANNPVIEADVKTSGYKFIAKFKKQLPEQAVTISEINFSSSTVFPTTDWVELLNFGITPVDLTGWFITDEKSDHKWIIPGSQILQANDRLVLTADIFKFSRAYPFLENALGSFGFGLGAPSDSVRLYNNFGKLIAGVKYSCEAPWPTETNNMGKTLELKDPYLSLNSPDNWYAGCLGGSPGAAFTLCDATGIGNSEESFLLQIYPNPAVDELNISLPTSMDKQNITCRMIDVMGKVVLSEVFSDVSRSVLKLSVANLSEGIYILQISNGYNQQNLKFIKRIN
jgi:hypothetical protein